MNIPRGNLDGSEAREVHDCGNLRTIHYFVDRGKNGEDDI